jgi:hypothetical protein
MARNTDSTSGVHHGSLLQNPVASFAPWIIFWVVAGPSTWEVACVSAVIVAVVLLLLQLDTGSVRDHFIELGMAHEREATAPPPIKLQAPKILDVGTVIFFAVFSVLGALVARSDLIQLEHYAQAISSGALGLIVLISILAGHPFTEAYARQSAPEEVWRTPGFRRINLVMSTVWFGIFAVSTILGLLATMSWASHGAKDWLEWYIPIGLIVLGFRFNQWYPAQVRARMAQAGGRTSPAT